MVNQRLKNLGKLALRGSVAVGSYGSSKLAMPSAVLSTMYGGSYVDRVYGGISSTFGIVGDVLSSYFNNTTFQVADLVNGAAVDVLGAMGDSAKNISEDPQKALYTGLITFGAMKLPVVLRYGQRRFSEFRKNRELENLRKVKEGLESKF